jgi:hypothetical protein
VEGIRKDPVGGDARAERRHTMDPVRREVDERSVGLYQQRWVAWPVAWSAIWVGALAALAAALVIGLIGLALGAHELVPPRRVVRVRDFGLGAAVFSVVGALLAFGAGGWVRASLWRPMTTGRHQSRPGARSSERVTPHDIRGRRGVMVYIILWLLGVPLILIILLWLVGIGR